MKKLLLIFLVFFSADIFAHTAYYVQGSPNYQFRTRVDAAAWRCAQFGSVPDYWSGNAFFCVGGGEGYGTIDTQVCVLPGEYPWYSGPYNELDHCDFTPQPTGCPDEGTQYGNYEQTIGDNADYCVQVGSAACVITKSGTSISSNSTGKEIASYTYTNANCSGESGFDGPVALPTKCRSVAGVTFCGSPVAGEYCAVGSDGWQYCTAADNCGAIDGQLVCPFDGKNCVRSPNGKELCLQPPDAPYSGQNSAPDGCIIDESGRKTCLNNDVRETTTTTTDVQPNGDGTDTTTTTTTKSNNVLGDPDQVTTTIDDGHGNVTSTVDQVDADQGSFDLGAKGSFDLPGQVSKTDAAKTGFSNKVSEIASEVDQFSLPEGSGSLPYWSVNILGSQIVMDLGNFPDFFDDLRTVLWWIAVISSIFILFG